MVFKARYALLKPQTNKVARAVKAGLIDGNKPRNKGYCAMFLRLCRVDVYGKTSPYTQPMGTAKNEAIRFGGMGLAIKTDTKLKEGDTAYKKDVSKDKETGEFFGHVGTWLSADNADGGFWAENSTIHGGDKDARGLRTKREFGKIDVLIRFPAP